MQNFQACFQAFMRKGLTFSKTSSVTLHYSSAIAILKGAVSQQSSSFCLILPITCPRSLWNLR